YSGRSVIVVGPDLKLYQCGLPKEMALELFKPFVMRRLEELGLAQNVNGAKKLVQRATNEVWDALEEVIKEHPVLLNRAPTLHRLGIQAFEPVLVEGRAIKLHPLVCTAYNADFDGDQMAVHVPLSAEAQAEARFLMLSANNLLKPQDGKPVTVPSQDMVLGAYYLTLKRPGTKGEGKAFSSKDEALLAYDAGEVSLHAPIKVRVRGVWNGEETSRIIPCTVGQIIFNQPIPQDLGFVDRNDPDHCFDLEITTTTGKGGLGKIIDKCIRKHGFATSAEVLDQIKSLGFKYSTRGATTISVGDMVVPEAKKEIIAAAEEQVEAITKKFRRGLLSEQERYDAVIKTWEKATDDVTEALSANLDSYNPIYMMADSGARGSMKQIRQLAGMRGLMANTSGKTIEIPIRANFREGLTVLEYFVSSRGARKGLADTALRTADSGYLTRRLVDVAQEVIIHEHDCGTTEGLWVSDIKDGKSVIEPLEERLLGRYPVDDIYHPLTGRLLVSKDKLMDAGDIAAIKDAGIESVHIRSVLNCHARRGVCQKCYGANLASGEDVNPGEAVGIVAAQSIGEPGTQLTMRTFHTGGIATAEDITQGLPRVEELFEARKPKFQATISEISGTVHLEDSGRLRKIIVSDDESGDRREYQISYSSKIRVTQGAHVEQGQQLTEGSVNPGELMRISGVHETQNYLIREVQKVYRLQGVGISDKHIEVIVRQMLRKLRVVESGSTDLLVGSLIDRSEYEAARAAVQQRINDGEMGLLLPVVEPVLQGITKASLGTESFLSAASFQETTRVLTEAAIKGKVDPLLGLKENVIIGKLIPAGTGMTVYQNTEIHVVEDAPPAAAAEETVEQQNDAEPLDNEDIAGL
ncbi:MAG: DNA-directed RNA polymerase subunit beta', partial [Clostridia bacterium]|nr:DNA-directed RNA polymerase subunit beta' [Clostridia bacterium]